MSTELHKMYKALCNITKEPTIPDVTESKREDVPLFIQESNMYSMRNIEEATGAEELYGARYMNVTIEFTVNRHTRQFQMSSITFPNGSVSYNKNAWSDTASKQWYTATLESRSLALVNSYDTLYEITPHYCFGQVEYRRPFTIPTSWFDENVRY